MTPNEAYKILRETYPTIPINQCTEYNDIFVFFYVDLKSIVLDGLMSVNKKTKEIRDFKPFYISLDDYENGKRIENFKGETSNG